MTTVPMEHSPQLFTHEAPAPAGTELIGVHDSYAGAQRQVDRLSDVGFPVQHLRILGAGLRSVEYVTGRLTTGRAALLGAGSGAWIGLFSGLLFALFAVGPAWIGAMLGAVVIGAGFGALFGFLSHRAQRGERDFSSVRGMEAARYEVYADAGVAAEARRLS